MSAMPNFDFAGEQFPGRPKKKASMLCCCRGVYIHHELQETHFSISVVGPGPDKWGWSDNLYWIFESKISRRVIKEQTRAQNVSFSFKFRVCLIITTVLCLRHRDTTKTTGWHVNSVLSLPGLGTVNNQADWTDRTLLAPSVSVLLYSLSCCFLSLKAGWRHPLGPTVGSRAHILPLGTRFSGSHTAQAESGRLWTQNQKERVIVYPPHGFEKGTLTPQIVVPKNLDGASGFALNKVSVVFMGIMVWSSWSGPQWLLSWSGFSVNHNSLPHLSFSAVSDGYSEMAGCLSKWSHKKKMHV